MTPAVLDRSPALPGSPAGLRDRGDTGAAREALALDASTSRGVGGQATLEDLISGVWEGLAVHRTVACPVCAGDMAPRYGAAGSAPVGGRCGDCGSALG